MEQKDFEGIVPDFFSYVIIWVIHPASSMKWKWKRSSRPWEDTEDGNDTPDGFFFGVGCCQVGDE
jgi:hypothetical protein